MGAIRTENEASASGDPYALASCSATCADRVEQLLAGIRPGNSSLDRRTRITGYMQSVVSACFSESHASVHLVAFGSVPLMTFLPDGDIDLSIMSADHSLKDVWATKLFNWLEEESSRVTADYKITNVQIINAEVKLLKCLVDNIVVDISYHQVGGITALRFLEEVDQMLTGHIFKRSIILVKAWCYYESRVLGAHHGLFSTYALEVLVLYVFNLHHKRIKSPIEVLYLFLLECSRFDWDHYCLCLKGRIPLSSFPNPSIEALVSEPLLTPEVEAECLRRAREYELGDMPTGTNTPPSTPAGTGAGGTDAVANPVTRPGFSVRAINIQDPLQPTNNVGRSVTRGNLFRVRKAFAYGATTLSKMLSKDGDECCAAFDDFFRNVWNAQRQGRQPVSYSTPGTSGMWAGQGQQQQQAALRHVSEQQQQQQHLAHMMLQRMLAGNRIGTLANGNGIPVLYAPTAGDLHLNNLITSGQQGQQQQGQQQQRVRSSNSNASSMPTTPMGGSSGTTQGTGSGPDDSLVSAVLSQAAHLAALQAVNEPGQQQGQQGQGHAAMQLDPNIAGALYSTHPLMLAYNQHMVALAQQHGQHGMQQGEGYVQGGVQGGKERQGGRRQQEAAGEGRQHASQQVPTPAGSVTDAASAGGAGSEHGGTPSVDTNTCNTPEPTLDLPASQHQAQFLGKVPMQGNPALGTFFNAAWLPTLAGQFMTGPDGTSPDPALIQAQHQAISQHLRQAAALQAMQQQLQHSHQPPGSFSGTVSSDAAGIAASAGGSSGKAGAGVGESQGAGDTSQAGSSTGADEQAAGAGAPAKRAEGSTGAPTIAHRHSISSPAIPDVSSHVATDSQSKVGVQGTDKEPSSGSGSGDGKGSGGTGRAGVAQAQHPHPAASIYHSRFNAALVGGFPGSMEGQLLGLSPPMPYYANMPPPPPPALAHNIQHSPPSLSFPTQARLLAGGRMPGPAPMWPPQGMANQQQQQQHNQQQRSNSSANANQQTRAPQQAIQLSPQTSEALPTQQGPSSHDGSVKARRPQGSTGAPTAVPEAAVGTQAPQQPQQMKSAFRNEGAAAAAAGDAVVGSAPEAVGGRGSRSGRHTAPNQDLDRDGSNDLMWQPSDAWSEDPPALISASSLSAAGDGAGGGGGGGSGSQPISRSNSRSQHHAPPSSNPPGGANAHQGSQPAQPSTPHTAMGQQGQQQQQQQQQGSMGGPMPGGMMLPNLHAAAFLNNLPPPPHMAHLLHPGLSGFPLAHLGMLQAPQSGNSGSHGNGPGSNQPGMSSMPPGMSMMMHPPMMQALQGTMMLPMQMDPSGQSPPMLGMNGPRGGSMMPLPFNMPMLLGHMSIPPSQGMAQMNQMYMNGQHPGGNAGGGGGGQQQQQQQQGGAKQPPQMTANFIEYLSAHAMRNGGVFMQPTPMGNIAMPIGRPPFLPPSGQAPGGNNSAASTTTSSLRNSSHGGDELPGQQQPLADGSQPHAAHQPQHEGSSRQGPGSANVSGSGAATSNRAPLPGGAQSGQDGAGRRDTSGTRSSQHTRTPSYASSNGPDRDRGSFGSVPRSGPYAIQVNVPMYGQGQGQPQGHVQLQGQQPSNQAPSHQLPAVIPTVSHGTAAAASVGTPQAQATPVAVAAHPAVLPWPGGPAALPAAPAVPQLLPTCIPAPAAQLTNEVLKAHNQSLAQQPGKGAVLPGVLAHAGADAGLQHTERQQQQVRHQQHEAGPAQPDLPALPPSSFHAMQTDTSILRSQSWVSSGAVSHDAHEAGPHAHTGPGHHHVSRKGAGVHGLNTPSGRMSDCSSADGQPGTRGDRAHSGSTPAASDGADATGEEHRALPTRHSWSRTKPAGMGGETAAALVMVRAALNGVHSHPRLLSERSLSSSSPSLAHPTERRLGSTGSSGLQPRLSQEHIPSHHHPSVDSPGTSSTTTTTSRARKQHATEEDSASGAVLRSSGSLASKTSKGPASAPASSQEAAAVAAPGKQPGSADSGSEQHASESTASNASGTPGQARANRSRGASGTNMPIIATAGGAGRPAWALQHVVNQLGAAARETAGSKPNSGPLASREDNSPAAAGAGAGAGAAAGGGSASTGASGGASSAAGNRSQHSSARGSGHGGHTSADTTTTTAAPSPGSAGTTTSHGKSGNSSSTWAAGTQPASNVPDVAPLAPKQHGGRMLSGGSSSSGLPTQNGTSYPRGSSGGSSHKTGGGHGARGGYAGDESGLSGRRASSSGSLHKGSQGSHGHIHPSASQQHFKLAEEDFPNLGSSGR